MKGYWADPGICNITTSLCLIADVHPRGDSKSADEGWMVQDRRLGMH